MTDRIRVRVYNVHFGDAILVSVPDADDGGAPLTRHVLIDVGNVLGGSGGDDDVFSPVLTDIRDQVGDHGVDLYVMTHEHLDHVQGLLYGATQQPPITFPVGTVWLTASAAPDYYDRFPAARKALEDSRAVYEAIQRHVTAAPDAANPRLLTLLENNNPRRTGDCVDHLRTQLTTADHVHYVFRGFATEGCHPFRTASFEILAPEEDTSEYYGRFKPMALGADAGLAEVVSGDVVPPQGVDTTAFSELVSARAGGAMANALALDQARNNTSVVFRLSWRGRALLFCGDAEVRSWQTMAARADLAPVDFIKVSHHGSHNGTPDPELLERVLPVARRTAAGPLAAVSTCTGTYEGVPFAATISELGTRCAAVVTTEDGPLFQDLFVEPAGAEIPTASAASA